MPDGALSDLKIVELAEMVAGPFCTKVMADLGAEVIKIESPKDGDPARQRGPFPHDQPHPERSALFLYLNTNKRGITLDVRKPESTRLFRDLLKDADILVEAWKPGTLAALGLGYEHLKALHPGLIVASLTPFGQTGPYKDYKAYDLNCYQFSVLGYETPFNQVTDPATQPPLKAAGEQANLLAGWTTATAIMCAVHWRHLTGEGQHLDMAEIEAAANMIRPNYPFYYYERPDGPNRARLSKRQEWGLPWVWPCRDGHVAILAITDKHWTALKELLGRPEWMDDELFNSPMGRFMHADVIRSLLETWLAEHDRDEIYRNGQALHLPIFPVQNLTEVMATRHFREREFFVPQEIPTAGPVLLPGPPFKMSLTPWSLRRPAPRLGQHNAEVYGGLGVGLGELARLQEQGVI
jgi:crotonobetainyl-CoA:carnitine CoA-transferase CaiB-like acyl-CoA transferase